VDSRSGSASPDRGSTNRSGFLHRGGSDRSSVERLRISTNRDSLRSSKEMNDHDQKDADKDLVDGDARGDEDNEPPGPAPGSRPSSPANSIGALINLTFNYDRSIHLSFPTFLLNGNTSQPSR